MQTRTVDELRAELAALEQKEAEIAFPATPEQRLSYEQHLKDCEKSRMCGPPMSFEAYLQMLEIFKQLDEDVKKIKDAKRHQ